MERRAGAGRHLRARAAWSHELSAVERHAARRSGRARVAQEPRAVPRPLRKGPAELFTVRCHLPLPRLI